MSFWAFIGTWFTRAFRVSWHVAHVVHQLCVILIGILVLLSILFGIRASHGEEPILLVVSPALMAILVFFGGLVWHAYRLYQEENGKRIALEHQAASPLRIVFDELRHKYEELPHKQAIIARVSVVNEGPDTIGNVALKIVKIEGKTNKHSELLKALVGVKLSISDNPTGPIVQPMEAPKDTAILHPKDSVTFDIARVCKRPGNHQILHASVFRRHPDKYPNHYSRRPDDVLPPGKYSLTIATSGDNLQPTEATFEFSGTTRRVTFRKISA